MLNHACNLDGLYLIKYGLCSEVVIIRRWEPIKTIQLMNISFYSIFPFRWIQTSTLFLVLLPVYYVPSHQWLVLHALNMCQHWLLHKFEPMKLQLHIFTATSETQDKFHCCYWDSCMGNKKYGITIEAIYQTKMVW